MDGYPNPGYFNPTCCRFVAFEEKTLSLSFQNSGQVHSLGVFMGDQDRALPTHAQNFEAHLFVGSHSPPKI